MSFPEYPAYRSSGIDWLGDVPQTWPTTRLRFVASFNPSKSEISGLYPETEVSFLPMDAIGDDGSLRLDERRKISEVSQGYTYFRDNDVAIAKITPCFENGKGALMRGLHEGIGFGTTELIIIRPDGHLTIGKYLQWLFFSPEFRNLATAAMYGAGGQKRVPDDFVRDFATALPPVTEQSVIADFLESETAKIDSLVAEQERLIELLKEKRQAVISEAVTKGLNQNVETKDSGVVWLGEVPEHWGIRKLRQLARLESGHTPSRQRPDYWIEDECVIPWFTLADVGYLRVERNTRIGSTSQKISQIGLENSAARLLPSNTVILSRTASVGFSGITDFPLAVSQDFAAWICKPELDPTYLLFCLRSMKPEFKRLMMGSTHQTIYMPDIEAFRVPFPPLAEQVAIAEFVQTTIDEIDTLSTEAERGIELLRERRSALISAAVTGKIDVRDLAPAIQEAA